MEKLTLSDIATVLVKKNKLSAKEAEAFVSAIFDVTHAFSNGTIFIDKSMLSSSIIGLAPS